MPQTQVSCPRCRQPVTVNVEQLFDITADPGAKQRLMSGASNTVRCPHCGNESRLATPIVYHDNEKELLLTFFPPELGLPLNEQERILGPYIKQVSEKLPPEKRKAYLFKPMANLTYESMIETILGKDGITPEMLKSQQERVGLIDRLLQVTSVDVRSEMIQQNIKLFDEQFFALFGRLGQSAAGSGQAKLAEGLADLQDQLLKETEFGRGLAESVQELEAATKSLQEAGQGLTREKLLELVIESPNDGRIRAYVSLARGGMDYSFFQMLTDKIEKAAGDEKTKLENIRERLLDFTNEVDRQMEARYKQAQKFVEQLLAQEDVAKAAQANLQNFTQDVVEIVQTMLRQASEKNDYTMMGKLQKVVEVLQAASAPPPEYALIEKLLEAPDDAGVDQILKENEAQVNQQFIELLGGVIAQSEAQGQGTPEEQMGLEQLQKIYKAALKFSMKKSLG